MGGSRAVANYVGGSPHAKPRDRSRPTSRKAEIGLDRPRETLTSVSTDLADDLTKAEIGLDRPRETLTSVSTDLRNLGIGLDRPHEVLNPVATDAGKP